MSQLDKSEPAALRAIDALTPERQSAIAAVAALREQLSMTLQQFALAVGLKSPGHMSRLEQGELPCSVRVALRIEELSGNRIDAALLNDDVAASRARCTGVHPAGCGVADAEEGAALGMAASDIKAPTLSSGKETTFTGNESAAA